MTETMAEILENVGFKHWNETDQKTLSTIMHNLVSGEGNYKVLMGASEKVWGAISRILDMQLERGE